MNGVQGIMFKTWKSNARAIIMRSNVRAMARRRETLFAARQTN